MNSVKALNYCLEGCEFKYHHHHLFISGFNVSPSLLLCLSIHLRFPLFPYLSFILLSSLIQSLDYSAFPPLLFSPPAPFSFLSVRLPLSNTLSLPETLDIKSDTLRQRLRNTKDTKGRLKYMKKRAVMCEGSDVTWQEMKQLLIRR